MTTRPFIRFPIIRVFSFALGIIFSLFLLVSWITFSKLLSFETILNNISNNALPEIALSGDLYNEATKLLDFTDLLANANSDAAKRLAEQKLNTYINHIIDLSNQKLNNSFLEKQLEVINLELLEFSDLIWQKANIEKQLQIKHKNIYANFVKAYPSYEQQKNTQIQKIDLLWFAEIPQLMILTDHAVGATRMQEARSLFAQIRDKITATKAVLAETNAPQTKSDIIRQFEQNLFSDEGLEYLIINHLKLAGRVIGRESFMRHLIEDFSRLLEMSTDETKDKIFEQVADSALKSQQQIRLIGMIIIAVILLIFAILLFIQQRIIKRIRQVNQIVKNKTEGNIQFDSLKGNDEITDLAEAFQEFAYTIKQQNQKLELMSMTDGLTNIANRRALDIRLQHDIELSVRQKSSVAVLLIDIDFFKLYNDNYGHAAGDEALKCVAEIISKALQRESDFVARYGGEEFVCVLPNTDLTGAEEMVKNIFDSLKTHNLPHEYSSVANRITISVGVALSTPLQVLMPETILKQADTALYAAKHAGKNNYKIYSTKVSIQPDI
ncbi:diguanylate cyclase [Paraglaciecola sp.]|uniref:diguanylate cyclase n=1 Tax=Paraglaciecola sp. TaxID=1920173 RepID=UPI003EF7CCFC